MLETIKNCTRLKLKRLIDWPTNTYALIRSRLRKNRVHDFIERKQDQQSMKHGWSPSAVRAT